MALIYQTRNLANINKLADNTKAKAKALHSYCEQNGLQILIYSTIRTIEEQKQNVANGASQTMKSYHLVGQALDFVMVNSKGEALWNAYNSADCKKVVAKAKALGFTWGGDWTSFKDSPHLQYEYKGYGTDTFNGTNSNTSTNTKPKTYMSKGDKGSDVKELQTLLIKAGYKIVADGIFGVATEKAVKEFQAKYKLAVDGLAGKATMAKLREVTKPKPTGIKQVGQIKVSNVKNFTYIYEKANDKSKKLAEAKKNSILPISGSVTGWYEVIYKGQRAYIKAKYCKRV